MFDKNKIKKLIIKSLHTVREDSENFFEINDSIKLMGSEGVLDSMDLVNLTTELEEKLADELDIDIIIASEKAFSRKISPFYNIETLLQFILELAEA